jgi:hypothetical protein
MRKIPANPVMMAIFVFVLVLFFGMARIVNAASIGISPAELSFDNVLKGGYAESAVSVSTSSETPLNFTISAQGAVKDWIGFEPSQNLTISRNEMKRVSIIVKPPATVANGVYTGNILVSTSSARTGGTGAGVGVTTGTTSDITVKITGDEIKKAAVENMEVRDTEEGYPVEFLISILNQGNVVITPLITIEISKKNGTDVLRSASHGETSILPTKMGIIRVKMGTEGLDKGEYAAKVGVFLGEEKLAESTLSFSLLERGTLSKKGVLQKIWNEPWVNAGDVVKIDAYFENQGEVLVSGKFKGEVYRAGKLVEVVESEELEAPLGKTIVLSAYFRPQFPGQYVVRGSVIYGGKTTETKESYINVGPQAGQPPADYMLFAVCALAAVFAAAVLLKTMFKKGGIKKG